MIFYPRQSLETPIGQKSDPDRPQVQCQRPTRPLHPEREARCCKGVELAARAEERQARIDAAAIRTKAAGGRRKPGAGELTQAAQTAEVR